MSTSKRRDYAATYVPGTMGPGWADWAGQHAPKPPAETVRVFTMTPEHRAKIAAGNRAHHARKRAQNGTR